jgi:hypothetical protein
MEGLDSLGLRWYITSCVGYTWADGLMGFIYRLWAKTYVDMFLWPKRLIVLYGLIFLDLKLT